MTAITGHEEIDEMSASPGSAAAPFARRNVALGGLELEFYEGGEGRPLMFLHDGEWPAPQGPFLAALAARFHVIAPVHPGFGGTVMPAWMNSIDDFTHAHLALARHLKLDRVILVGASIGGWVAAEMATANAGLVERLILIGPVGIKVGPVDRLDVPDIFAMAQSEIDRLFYFRPETWRLDPARKSDAELEIIAQNRETVALVTWEPYMHNPKLKHRLATIDRPTLVLRGAHDGFVSQDYAESFARLIPGARLEAIAAAGHLAHIEEPAAVAKSLARFLGDKE
jgi:pimeloyl-ACP methyl ester carboxylesterase